MAIRLLTLKKRRRRLVLIQIHMRAVKDIMEKEIKNELQNLRKRKLKKITTLQRKQIGHQLKMIGKHLKTNLGGLRRIKLERLQDTKIQTITTIEDHLVINSENKMATKNNNYGKV